MGAAPVLLTDRLELSPLTVDDADGMMIVVADERMYEFTGGVPPTLDQLRARYQALAVGASPDGTARWCNWIVRRHRRSEPIGVIQATVGADGTTADIAWEVGLPWQGNGIASEAASAVAGWLAGEGVDTLRARIHPDHQASARVAERLGLSPTPQVLDGEIVWLRSMR